MELSDGMSIEAYSVMNAQANVMSAVSVSMLKKTLDTQEMMGAQMTRMMELSVNPGLGANINTFA